VLRIKPKGLDPYGLRSLALGALNGHPCCGIFRARGVTMASNSDDLEEALQQNLKLRRELGTEVAKARSGRTNRKPDAPATPRNTPPQLTTAEARQGTGPGAMFWVLICSLALAVIAGLALGLAFEWIPRPWSGPL
jgi:hypothetical protein